MITELRTRLEREADAHRRENGVNEGSRVERLLAALPHLETGSIQPGRAGFGSEVKLRDLDSGAEFDSLLLSGDRIDVDAGEVSLASPIGQALLGRRVGDEISVSTPRGQRRFQLLALTTILQSLGMETASRPATSAATVRPRRDEGPPRPKAGRARAPR